jgi:hypothetical protein
MTDQRPSNWELAGVATEATPLPIKAAGGMLLFGISTAYIFAVLQVYWPMLSELFMIRGHPR